MLLYLKIERGIVMENEKLKIFNDSGYLGIATREEVHRIGHWHETFH